MATSLAGAPGVDQRPAAPPAPVDRGVALTSQNDALAKQIDTANQDVVPDHADRSAATEPARARGRVAGRTLVRTFSFASTPAITKDQRTLLGAGVGFLLGLAGLLIFEFLNARVRDVGGTESAARMPLVAEIPALKMSRADRFRVLTAEDPASLMAEAYRSLRTSIIAMWQRHPDRPRERRQRQRQRRTSPRRGARCARCSSRRRARPRASRSPR